MIKVWDGFVRFFHWTLVLLMLGAFLSEDIMDVHEIIGITIAILIFLRIIWGFIGTKHARFGDFVPTPKRFFAYMKSMVRGRETRFLGHNPAGGAMVVVLILTIIIAAGSGLLMLTDEFWGNEYVEEIHEFFSNAMLLLIVIHVGGVLYASIRHNENLIKSMINGFKKIEES